MRCSHNKLQCDGVIHQKWYLWRQNIISEADRSSCCIYVVHSSSAQHAAETQTHQRVQAAGRKKNKKKNWHTSSEFNISSPNNFPWINKTCCLFIKADLQEARQAREMKITPKRVHFSASAGVCACVCISILMGTWTWLHTDLLGQTLVCRYRFSLTPLKGCVDIHPHKKHFREKNLSVCFFYASLVDTQGIAVPMRQG